MKALATKAPKEERIISAEEKQEDYYKGFRSGVVLVWVFSNLVLVSAILSTGLDDLDPGNPEQNESSRAVIYMAVVLYSVAVLSFFRFAGAMWFLVVRMVSAVLMSFSLPTQWLMVMQFRGV